MNDVAGQVMFTEGDEDLLAGDAPAWLDAPWWQAIIPGPG